MSDKPKPKSQKSYDVIRPKAIKPKVAEALIEQPDAARATTKTWTVQSGIKLIQKLLGSVKVFEQLYAIVALVVLTLTTVLWSVLGAHLQAGNADQLVDPRLFDDQQTFQSARFPGTHTFLLKWPLFWLIRAFHDSALAFILVTVGSVLVTIAVLVIILYKIERRLIVFGTLCLALASTLLLVPAQPYVGAILPVNMAMLATRNLEYTLFLLSLVAIIRARRARSWLFVAGVIGLSILMASDKLFVPLAGVAAITMLFIYALRQRQQLVTIGARWLLASLLAAAGAIAVLGILDASGTTHIVSGAASSSPYNTVKNGHDLALAVIYGGLGLLTNFGANPAYDAVKLHDIAPHAQDRLLAIGGISYVVNLVILIAGLWAVWRIIYGSLRSNEKSKEPWTVARLLALTLALSTLVAAGLFVATNHYYAVDARYLTIAVFAVFVAAAASARQRVLRRRYVVIAGGIMLLATFISIPTVINSYADQQAAYTTVNKRNDLIVQAMSQRPKATLVGDYWRVIPAKQAAPQPLKVLPLETCTTPRNTLTSDTWQPNLRKQSFAYLLSLDASLTDFPHCTLDDAVKAYGHPDSSLVIAGTYAKPQELLLFYDHGSHPHPKKANASNVVSTVAPLTASQLTNTTCDGPSLMTIVAHQDDDLLFTSPDLLHRIYEGYCIRTVYVTAGDAGHGKFYWLSREQASEAAYDEMDGPTKDVWMQRTLQLAPKQYVTVASPRGNSKISLIFMHLPDGNINGSGFSQSNFQSLEKLLNGRVDTMQAVDDQSSYTGNELVASLASLMHIYTPSEIHTQAPNNASQVYPDHSDHLAVGRFTKQAYDRYEQQQYANQLTVPIKYYLGYPIHERAPNISGDDLQQKQAAFLSYAKFDGSVCHSVEQCASTSTYGSYLTRQYATGD